MMPKVFPLVLPLSCWDVGLHFPWALRCTAGVGGAGTESHRVINPGALKTLDSVSTIIGMSRRKTKREKKKHHQRVKSVLNPKRQRVKTKTVKVQIPRNTSFVPSCWLVLTGSRLYCFTVSWSQLVGCFVIGCFFFFFFWVSAGRMRCRSLNPFSAAIARWGALWSRRVWRAGWAMGPGRGVYQRAGCGRWAPHQAPCPLTPLGCRPEPLQPHPAGICKQRH